MLTSSFDAARAVRLSAWALLLAGFSLGAARAGSDRSTDGPGVILVFNATASQVKYHVYPAGARTRGSIHALAPGSYHLFRVSEHLVCSFGDPRVERRLRPGMLHEFRKAGKTLSLVDVPLRPAGSATPVVPAASPDLAARVPEKERHAPGAQETRTTRLRNEVSLLHASVASLQRELRASRQREQEALTLLKQPTGPAVQFVAPKGAVMLGTTEAVDGVAQVRFDVPLRHDAGSSIKVCLAADFGSRVGRVRVQPDLVDVAPRGTLTVSLTFAAVPAGGEVAGKLVLSGAGGHRLTRLEVPVTVRFLTRLTRLPAGTDSLCVLSWPPGAEVYLSDPMARYPGSRVYLGTTPVCRPLPPGRYRVLLLPQRSGAGRWVAPEGVCGVLEAGPNSLSCLDVGVSKAKGAPALVRAFWLSGAATPARLLQATDGAADLFTPPPFDQFQVCATRILARADVALATDDARRLHRVMGRCGYLRYEVGEAGIELGLCPGNRAEPLSFKVVMPGAPKRR